MNRSDRLSRLVNATRNVANAIEASVGPHTKTKFNFSPEGPSFDTDGKPLDVIGFVVAEAGLDNFVPSTPQFNAPKLVAKVLDIKQVPLDLQVLMEDMYDYQDSNSFPVYARRSRKIVSALRTMADGLSAIKSSAASKGGGSKGKGGGTKTGGTKTGGTKGTGSKGKGGGKKTKAASTKKPVIKAASASSTKTTKTTKTASPKVAALA